MRRFGSRVFFALLMAGGFFIGLGQAPASAQVLSDTTTMLVTVDVVPECTFSVTDLIFDDYTGNGIKDAEANGEVTCQSQDAVQYTVFVGGGQNPVAQAQRRMENGLGSFLTYELWPDSPRVGTELGDTNITTGSTTFAGNEIADSTGAAGVPDPFGVFGRIPAGQNVDAGTYFDLVLLTIEY